MLLRREARKVFREKRKDLGGRPLIAYSIEVAKQKGLISHLIVSTDDEEIANMAKEFGADVPFMRPVELASDTVVHADVMKHAVGFMEERLGIF